MAKNGPDNPFSNPPPFPLQLDVYLDSHAGPTWEISDLRHRMGWLAMVECQLDTPLGSEREFVFAATWDEGAALATSLPRECHFEPPETLMVAADAAYWDFLGRMDQRHLRLLRDRETEDDAALRALDVEADRVMRRCDEVLAAFARARRAPDCPTERVVALKAKAAEIEEGMASAMRWLTRQKAGIREAAAAFEADVFDSLITHGDADIVSLIHWRARTGRRPPEIKWPLQSDERPNRQIDEFSEEAHRAEVFVRAAQAEVRAKRADREPQFIRPVRGYRGVKPDAQPPKTNAVPNALREPGREPGKDKAKAVPPEGKAPAAPLKDKRTIDAADPYPEWTLGMARRDLLRLRREWRARNAPRRKAGGVNAED
jgi:hypothetical protein